jgi:hypothetical protein
MSLARPTRPVRSSGTPRRAVLLVALVLSGAASPAVALAQSRGAIAGKVTDANTGQPIRDATIAVRGRRDAETTDSAGRFTVDELAPGTLIVQVRAVGFGSASRIVEVSAGQTASVDVELASAQQLGEVVVEERQPRLSSRLRDFEERRKSGRGQYLTREDLAKSNASTLTDVLRRLRGVQTTCQGGGCFISFARSPIGCLPQYIVDGRPQPEFGPGTAIGDIYGVEVYAGSSETPAEFVGEGGCGTIVIWTRSAP